MRTHARVAVACFAMMAAVYAGALVGSCAHVNTPAGFVACMASPQDEKAAEDIVFSLLDGNDSAALALALASAPDVVRCLLERAAAAKGAGPVESARARRAREFLDAHPKGAAFEDRHCPGPPLILAGFCVGCGTASGG